MSAFSAETYVPMHSFSVSKGPFNSIILISWPNTFSNFIFCSSFVGWNVLNICTYSIHVLMQTGTSTSPLPTVLLKVYLLCTCFWGHTLLEKQSKFPRYNMKFRGKHDNTWNIQRIITFSRYISCYIAESRFPLGQCNLLSLSLSICHYMHCPKGNKLSAI